MKNTKYRLLPEQGVFALPELRDSVEEFIKSSKILDAYPSATEIEIQIGNPIDAGSSLVAAHKTWKASTLDHIESIGGHPFREIEERCPDNLRRISINFIKRRTPGMGSFYGYEGYFISLLVNLDSLTVWDARGEEAL